MRGLSMRGAVALVLVLHGATMWAAQNPNIAQLEPVTVEPGDGTKFPLYNPCGIELGKEAKYQVMVNAPDSEITWTVATPDELVKEEWEPNDWNSGPGPRFYSSVLKQRALVARLLMLGQPWESGQADIPLGRIYGVRYYSDPNQADLTWVPVGLLDDWDNEYMNRDPRHK